jgi:hypothetical protein
MGKGAADKPGTVQPPAASLSPPQVAVAAPVVLAAVPIAAAASSSGSPASAAASKASPARRAASAAVRPKTAASAMVAEPPRAIPTAAPRRDEPRVTTAPAAGPNPVDACRDKIFLSREFCLAEHCPKPALRGHPLCVQWREEVKLREESRTRNN